MIPLDLRDIHVKVHHQWRFQKTDHFPAAFLSSCCLTFLSYIAIKNGIFSDTLLSILRKIFYFIISNRPKCLRFKHASISWPHRENIFKICFLQMWSTTKSSANSFPENLALANFASEFFVHSKLFLFIFFSVMKQDWNLIKPGISPAFEIFDQAHFVTNIFLIILAWSSWNNFIGLSRHDAIVIFGLEAAIDKQRHSIGQNIKSSVGIHLQVIGENESIRVGVDKSLVLWVERFLDVPASNSITIDLRVEDDIGFVIIELSSGLRFRSTITQQGVCMIRVRWSGESFVLQNGVGNWKLFCGRQCMEVYRAITRMTTK